MDNVDSAFQEELDVLHAIFAADELAEEKLNDRILLKFQINPDVANNTNISNDSRRYCSLKLEISAKLSYPSTPPEVQIRNPRGLTDDQIEILNAKITSFITENRGQCVLYDIIRIAQDFLTHEDFSLPKLPCCICLSQFEKSDSIYVTNKCHHHFHSSCIGRYVQHCVDEKAAELDIMHPPDDAVPEQICCPICRFPIPFSEIKCTLDDSKAVSQTDGDTNHPSTSKPSWSHLSNPIERNFKSLYEKQKLQGGLIDLEKEKNKMLITDQTRLIRQTECLPSTSGEHEKLKAASSSSQWKEPQRWQNNFARRDYHNVHYGNRRNWSSDFHSQQNMMNRRGNWNHFNRSSRGRRRTSSRHVNDDNSGQTFTNEITSMRESEDDRH